MQHGHRLALSLAGNGGRQIYGEHDDGCADGLWSADYHRVALANMQHAAFLEIAFHNKLGWMVLFFFFFSLSFWLECHQCRKLPWFFIHHCLPDGFMEAIS